MEPSPTASTINRLVLPSCAHIRCRWIEVARNAREKGSGATVANTIDCARENLGVTVANTSYTQ